MKAVTMSEDDMRDWGQKLGASFRGGECIELIGDVGAGKTTLTKGIAKGMGIDEEVQSPTFTLSRVYENGTLALHHYDFYRLAEPGVMSYELDESVNDPRVVSVVEWAQTVSDVLPRDRISISLRYTPDGTARIVTTTASEKFEYLPL